MFEDFISHSVMCICVTRVFRVLTTSWFPKPWLVISISMSKHHVPSVLKSPFVEKHLSFCDIGIASFLMTY